LAQVDQYVSRPALLGFTVLIMRISKYKYDGYYDDSDYLLRVVVLEAFVLNVDDGQTPVVAGYMHRDEDLVQVQDLHFGTLGPALHL
jgi:hypothetical protein